MERNFFSKPQFPLTMTLQERNSPYSIINKFAGMELKPYVQLSMSLQGLKYVAVNLVSADFALLFVQERSLEGRGGKFPPVYFELSVYFFLMAHAHIQAPDVISGPNC